MTFIDSEDVWIEAYLTENNLGRVSLGDRVEVVLDIHPGRILEGLVQSYSGAISTGSSGKSGHLQTVPRASGWMRDPQRFPLRIILPDYRIELENDDLLMQFNGQADVIIYTGDNTFLNVLGAAYIRLNAWLSYAY